MNWTQQTMFVDDDTVTQVTLKIGAVGTGHTQFQFEVYDEAGSLLAMSSTWHCDLALLQDRLVTTVGEIMDALQERHSPF